MRSRYFVAGFGFLTSLAVVWGCSSSVKTDSAAESARSKTLLEPFTPPPLAEIDAKAEWINQPVVDATEKLRALQAKEKPLVTVREALALKNDSAEANAKILSALGRLPESEDEVDWDARFVHHIPADVKTTNPLLSSTLYEADLNGYTAFSLLSFDWNMEPFAGKDTVVSWQTSKDRLYDKIVMRKDLTWSDGKPITAHDVAFSFQAIMNPDVPALAVRTGTDRLRWVHAYDDHTVVFFHKDALATNVWNILFPIIPKHIYEETLTEDPTLQNSSRNVELENNPVCGGAYEITGRVRGQEITLTRRESWYMHEGKQVRDKPYIKEIRFRIIEDSNTALLALKSGQIDDLMLTPEQWVAQTTDNEYYTRNTKATGPEWSFFHFSWNCRDPLFQDKRVRQAMGYAFDHDEMLKNLNYGLYEPATGIFHPTSWMAPKKPLQPYKQDLEKAEKLLDEAGWTDHDGDGIRDKEIGGRSVPFRFNILVGNMPDRIKICTLLKTSLERIGIVCNVQPIEFTQLQQRWEERKFQAYCAGLGSGTDPDTSENIWASKYANPKTGRNYSGYSNPEVDRLFEEGRKEFDKEKRAAIYSRIHELIYEDQPDTFLYYRSSFFGFNKDLRGYKFSPRGPYNYSPGALSLWKPR